MNSNKLISTILATLVVTGLACTSVAAASTTATALSDGKSTKPTPAPDAVSSDLEALMTAADALHEADGGAWRVYEVAAPLADGTVVLTDAEAEGGAATPTLTVAPGELDPAQGVVVAGELVLGAFDVAEQGGSALGGALDIKYHTSVASSGGYLDIKYHGLTDFEGGVLDIKYHTSAASSGGALDIKYHQVVPMYAVILGSSEEGPFGWALIRLAAE